MGRSPLFDKVLFFLFNSLSGSIWGSWWPLPLDWERIAGCGQPKFPLVRSDGTAFCLRAVLVPVDTRASLCLFVVVWLLQNTGDLKSIKKRSLCGSQFCRLRSMCRCPAASQQRASWQEHMWEESMWQDRKQGPAPWCNWISCHLSIPYWSTFSLTTPLLNQHPANAHGKAADEDLSTWAPETRVGDTDGVPGSWLYPDFTWGCCGYLRSRPVNRKWIP